MKALKCMTFAVLALSTPFAQAGQRLETEGDRQVAELYTECMKQVSPNFDSTKLRTVVIPKAQKLFRDALNSSGVKGDAAAVAVGESLATDTMLVRSFQQLARNYCGDLAGSLDNAIKTTIKK